MEQCVAECKNHNFDSNTLSYTFFIGTAHYLSIVGGGGGGGGAKKLGCHMNFHVASRRVDRH